MKRSELMKLKWEYEGMPFMFKMATSFYDFLCLKCENDITESSPLYPPKNIPRY